MNFWIKCGFLPQGGVQGCWNWKLVLFTFLMIPLALAMLPSFPKDRFQSRLTWFLGKEREHLNLASSSFSWEMHYSLMMMLTSIPRPLKSFLFVANERTLFE